MSRVLLLCAINVEWKALSTLIDDPVDRPLGQTFCRTGRVTIGSRTLDVALVEVGVGGLDAALNTGDAVRELKPELVLFVGVAGGVKDVALGDIVIASKVHFYETGKVTKGKFLPRPSSPQIPYRVEQLARSLARNEFGTFVVRVGAIAAGEKVVASKRSATAVMLSQNYSDTLALEMEGAGFISAMRRHSDVDYALIRGISDLLDAKQTADNGGWQSKAAQNATSVAHQFICEYFRYVAPIESVSSTNALTLDLVRKVIPVPGPNETYVLLAPRNSAHAAAILASSIPISLVADLDASTDSTGLLATHRGNLSKTRLIRLSTLADNAVYSRSSVTWLAINGLDQRMEPLDLRQWIRTMRRNYRSALVGYGTMNGGRHTTIIVPIDNESDTPWMRVLVDDIVTELGEACTVVMLTDRICDLPDVGQDHELQISTDELYRSLCAISTPTSYSPAFLIPSEEGHFEVTPEDVAWLKEDLDIWPIGIAEKEDSEQSRLHFLRGGKIGPGALAVQADVFRDIYAALKADLEVAVSRRRTLRINIFHEPGAGGSTLARRCMYDFHAQTPCAAILRIAPGETSRRIDWLTRQSNSLVLCIVDRPEISDATVADLVSELQSTSTPAIVLNVSRRYSAPSELSTSSYLRAALSPDEASDFFGRYVAEAPRAFNQLEKARDGGEQRCNAFYFGLSAFEEKFEGLQSYVSHRLINLAVEQAHLLLYCSIAHYYGQRGIPEHLLARLLGLPSSRASGLASLLVPSVRALLWRSVDGSWRTIHQLIAKEVMVQLGNDAADWRQHLTSWGRDFATFCRSEGPVINDLEVLAKSVFFDRGNQELLGTEIGGRDLFSRFVEDVPSPEGAVELLSHVANLFDEQPHFAAHVARFYAYRLRNFTRATEQADLASRLDPDSATLHHVLGMVHRAGAYDAIGRRAAIDEVAQWGDRASDAFAASRSIRSNGNEYAYISDAQLKIRIVDYAIRAHRSIGEYLRKNPDPYVVNCISSAEDLLSRVRAQGDARQPSNYEEHARGKLASLYGDFELALRMFDSLLSRTDADPLPIRRQIVWTHLARADRHWHKLQRKAVVRIVKLLEENFDDGHYASSDVRQWWRAIRYLEVPPSQDRVFEVMAYWRTEGRSIDSLYSSYVSYATDVLDGIRTATSSMEKYLGECSSRARGLAHRTLSFDWLGAGSGVSRLIHQSELGGWDRTREFWSDTSKLVRVTGRVSEIRGPQAGTVDVVGMRAFFVPSRTALERGRDENTLVTGYLGFSQDGPRLWEVRTHIPTDAVAAQ